MSCDMTKPTKWVCAQRTQISLGPVWSQSLLSAWRNLGSLAIHWAHSEDSDQTGWMPRLIWVFAGCTLILLVLSCSGSNIFGKMVTLKPNRISLQSCCLDVWYCVWYPVSWQSCCLDVLTELLLRCVVPCILILVISSGGNIHPY